MKKSEITIEVHLDENKHPNKIYWDSDDDIEIRGKKEAKAMLLSFFDKDYKDTYKIDLWTSEMQVVEMDRFIFQTIRSLADTYYRATNNGEVASAIHSLSEFIGEKTGILTKEEK
jgi:gliding motility-associated protein GldC